MRLIPPGAAQERPGSLTLAFSFARGAAQKAGKAAATLSKISASARSAARRAALLHGPGLA